MAKIVKTKTTVKASVKDSKKTKKAAPEKIDAPTVPPSDSDIKQSNDKFVAEAEKTLSDEKSKSDAESKDYSKEDEDFNKDMDKLCNEYHERMSSVNYSMMPMGKTDTTEDHTLIYTGKPSLNTVVGYNSVDCGGGRVVTQELIDAMNKDTQRINASCTIPGSVPFTPTPSSSTVRNETWESVLKLDDVNFDDIPASFVKAVSKYDSDGCNYVLNVGHSFTLKVDFESRCSEITIMVGTEYKKNGAHMFIESKNLNGASFCINADFNAAQLDKCPNAKQLYNYVASVAKKMFNK